jgi:hypothetical protein
MTPLYQPFPVEMWQDWKECWIEIILHQCLRDRSVSPARQASFLIGLELGRRGYAPAQAHEIYEEIVLEALDRIVDAE